MAEAPTARLFKAQVTGPVPLQLPCVADDEPKAIPDGSVSVTFTFVAVAGPLLVTLIRYVRLWLTCPGFGEADLLTARSTLEGLITFTVTCVAWMVLPAVPVMLTGKSPNGVPAVVVIVNVALLDVASVMLIEAGLKFADAPAGNPVALRFTVPEKPADGVIVVMYCALAPGVTARVDGAAIIEKSGVDANGAEATKVR